MGGPCYLPVSTFGLSDLRLARASHLHPKSNKWAVLVQQLFLSRGCLCFQSGDVGPE